MTAAQVGLAASVFLACAVEAVEALTVVLAVGSSRSWRSALWATAAALALLAAVVGVLGGALSSLPIDDLRVVIGALLLAVGLQWLRKAILRAAGRKARRDERDVFARDLAAARAAAPAGRGWDGYSFAIAFQAVLLEGLEVALIVVGFGALRDHTALVLASAASAIAAVVAVGVAVRAPLARVPENTMKFTVGVLLSAFGVFWLVEGAGLQWPGGEAMLVALAGAVWVAALLAVACLRSSSR
jgi:uncharacterized membrane protein